MLYAFAAWAFFSAVGLVWSLVATRRVYRDLGVPYERTKPGILLLIPFFFLPGIVVMISPAWGRQMGVHGTVFDLVRRGKVDPEKGRAYARERGLPHEAWSRIGRGT